MCILDISETVIVLENTKVHVIENEVVTNSIIEYKIEKLVFQMFFFKKKIG